jgi:hypothetical protein
MHENRGVVVRIQKLTEERRSKGAYWCWILCKINYKIATVSRLYALPLSHDFRINLVNSTFLLACLPCSWVRSVSTNHMITTIKSCLPRLLGFSQRSCQDVISAHALSRHPHRIRIFPSSKIVDIWIKQV